MAEEKSVISAEECAFEVKLMARRAALLHYFFSRAIVDELGPEAGERLIRKAILAYGAHCGKAVREEVEALGLPLTQESFDIPRDLPHYGWDMGLRTLPDGEQRRIVRYCPLADTFAQFGPEGVRLGQLYCYVDQAKQQAFNPDYDFIHTRNVLDGDPCCEFLVQRRG